MCWIRRSNTCHVTQSHDRVSANHSATQSTRHWQRFFDKTRGSTLGGLRRQSTPTHWWVHPCWTKLVWASFIRAISPQFSTLYYTIYHKSGRNYVYLPWVDLGLFVILLLLDSFLIFLRKFSLIKPLSPFNTGLCKELVIQSCSSHSVNQRLCRLCRLRYTNTETISLDTFYRWQMWFEILTIQNQHGYRRVLLVYIVKRRLPVWTWSYGPWSRKKLWGWWYLDVSTAMCRQNWQFRHIGK